MRKQTSGKIANVPDLNSSAAARLHHGGERSGSGRAGACRAERSRDRLANLEISPIGIYTLDVPDASEAAPATLGYLAKGAQALSSWRRKEAVAEQQNTQ